MSNGNAQFIHDTLLIQKLAEQEEFRKFAFDMPGGSLFTSILSVIKNLISYDEKHPVESILAFLGPGILFKLGFPWMSGLYTIMEALGFDFTGCFTAIKEKLEPLLTNEIPSYSNISEIVGNAISGSFSGAPDDDKLKEIINKQSNLQESIKDAVQLKKIAINLSSQKVSLAGIGSILKNILSSKLGKFFKSIISWIIMAALISSGFKAAGSAASSLLGIKKDKQSGDSSEQVSFKKPQLTPNPNMDPSITEFHQNDLDSVWLAKLNINNIQDYLVSWAIEAYPQLYGHESEIKQSQNFQQMVDLFERRNEASGTTQIMAFPRPYERIIDIVNSFVVDMKVPSTQSTPLL